MQRGDLVRHKTKGWLGKVREIKGYRAFIDWSDDEGVRFRWACVKELEVINENR